MACWLKILGTGAATTGVSSVATFAEHTVDAITRDWPPRVVYFGDDSGRPLNSRFLQ
jgi:hypothetical protein